MPRVDFQRQLNVPVVPARSAIAAILHEIEQKSGSWGDFALYLDFKSLGLPDVGYVAIPIEIEGVSEALEPRHEIRFQIHARRGRDAFPTFDGAVGIDALGPSSAQLWLAGDYQPPLRSLGPLLDQFIGGGKAAKALENMLAELADAVDARVQQREQAGARYRLIFRD
jgi:hypothetical protein